jgi:membrane-associated phospholipid phosphatase
VLANGTVSYIPDSASPYFRPLTIDEQGQIISIGSNDPNGGFHSWYALPYTPYGYGSTGNLPFISEDASKSFPSGHETMAAVGFYSLVSLPFTVRRLNTKKIRRILFVVAVVGSGLVAFCRLLAGAHYLSDVTIGSLIAIGLLVIFHCQYCYGSKHLDH